MLSKRHYSIALIGAALLHLAGFLLLTHSIEGGAADKGEQGIEIDLGMIGDLGSSVDTQKSATPETDAPEAEEAIELKNPIQKLIQKPIKALPELRQVAEITVKKVKHTKPEFIDNSKIKQTLSDYKKPPKKALADGIKPDQISSRKFSTGTADALTSGGNIKGKPTYFSVIAAKLAKYKRYPRSARRKGEEGTVLLSFTIRKSGLVKNMQIKKSSGHTRLDRAVKKMLEEASPLPPFPPEEFQQEITITIPIVFKLN